MRQNPGATTQSASSYPDWVVLHVPHDSDYIPPDIRQQFLLDDAELRQELIHMTDHRTFDLFKADQCHGRYVRAGVSRLVVDVERFVDDKAEAMASRGMGVLYTQSFDRAPMRHELTESDRTRLLARYYFPHHARLETLVDETLERWGQCLLLDCHSFPSLPLPYELNQAANRPDICIGTDSYHTPKVLTDAFVYAFESAGFSVAVNSPFAGALVPMKHYQIDARVNAVMVEINRRLYLDELAGTPLPCIDLLSDQVVSVCQLACGEV